MIILQSARKHFEQIKEGGIIVFVKKIISFIYLILQLPIYLTSIPMVIIIRLIRPWFLIRWQELYSSRIGHFAADSGQQFVANSLNSKRTLDIYWLSKYISNKQLELMVRRNFLVFNFVRYLD